MIDGNNGRRELRVLPRVPRELAFEAATGQVEVGKPCQIDRGVLLGYLSGRDTEHIRLVIGPGGRIRSGTVIYAGTRIGARLQTGHNVVIREENVIGDELNIWNNSTIDYGCSIGSGVKIHTNVYVAQFTVLEDGVFLAPGVTIANDLHPGADYSKETMRGPTIKKGAQIGCNVTILPFVTIGELALVGAGSVVVHDVPPRSVVAGNPARVIKSIDDLSSPSGARRPYRRLDIEGEDR